MAPRSPSVVTARSSYNRPRRRLDMGAGGRERQHLSIDACARELLCAKANVAVPAHDDVEVSGIADDRVVLAVGPDSRLGRTGTQGIEVG
jgi:hypothetical protein